MSLFNSNEERELWIKLNAERQIEWEKSLTWFNPETKQLELTKQALHPRSFGEAIIVAKNQLECDERLGKLRYSLTELLTLSTDGLNEIDAKRHKIWCEEFKKL